MRRLGAALACSALLTAGCGGSDGGRTARDADRAAGADAERKDRVPAGTAVRETLERRGRALARGRARAYAATSLPGAQRRADLVAARRLRGLGVRRISIEVIGGQVEGAAATADVALRYAVRGIPGRLEIRRELKLRRQGSRWRVSSVEGREQPPWEVGAFERRRTEHFVILTPPDIPAEPLERALEAGYARTSEALVRPKLEPRYLVMVAGSSAQARRLTESISGVGGLAAIADADVREEGPAGRVAEVLSQRLVVVWPQFADTDEAGRERVITHELTHAALVEATSGRTPSWLLEGIALYVSDDRRVDEAAQLVTAGGSRQVRRALTLSGLSRPDAIARLSGKAQNAAYAYASSAAFYIAERYGSKRLLRLYDSFRDEALAGPAGGRLTDRAVRQVLGKPLTTLERDLRRWIVTRAIVAPLSP